MHKFIKWRKHQNQQIHKSENVNFSQCETSKKVKNRGGLISALKPGPVVPPGTQKVPDQAARISQSVSFGHLSDILAILRGGQFLSLFLLLFLVFNFITFSDFLNFHVFDDLRFLIIFCHF